MKKDHLFVAVALAAIASLRAASGSAAPCESLATLSLPHTTVTLANVVAAGSFVQFPPGRGGPIAPPAPRAAAGATAASTQGAEGRRGEVDVHPSPFADLPAFCRVTTTLTPSNDSEIKM